MNKSSHSRANALTVNDMAEDFPDDSFFRNSNVALLEAASDISSLQKNATCGPEKSSVKGITDSSTRNALTKHAFSVQNQINLDELNLKSNSEQIPIVGSKYGNKRQKTVFELRDTKRLLEANDDSKQIPKTELPASPRSKPNGRKKKSSDTNDDTAPMNKGTKSHKHETKDTKKSDYRPLNITRSVLHTTKQSDTLSQDSGCESHPESTDAGSKEDTLLQAQDTGSSTEASTLIDNSDVSLLSTQQKLRLDSWGLPPKILHQYAKRGITSMFSWQVECLCSPRVLVGGNLVYSAPTSAGKTLVSEILCIKAVLEKRKKALFILPFVSVVREKMFYFQELLSGSGIRVDGYMGGHAPAGGFRALDLAVCTIEKANSLINKLMEEDNLSSLGTVVVDELHLLGDSHRGYLLELLLTKLKYMSAKDSNVTVQLVGMSATLPNLSLLTSWLDADLYKTTFRPVPLEEYIKVGNQVYDNAMKPVRTISPEILIKGDADNIVYLCLETIAEGHSVLIFCPTKNRCESLAQNIASEFRIIGLNRDPNAPQSLAYKLREQLNPTSITQALEQLRRCPVGLDNILSKTMSFGVAFHHAGLTMDERDIVEGSFRNGALRVVVATSTLSSGVNLPARRVIVRSPMFHGQPIDILTYRQMIGRAGRMGVDTAGESFLVCQKAEKRVAEALVRSQLKPIKSCLGLGNLSASLKRAILEVIASGVATTPQDVELYTNCTLLAVSCKKSGSDSFLHSQNLSVSSNPVTACVNFLKDSEFIRLQTGADGTTHYVPTPLGQACLSASLPPDEGIILFQELQRARQCFVLENELHIIYQVTPFSVSEQWSNLDWLQVLALWEQLPKDMKRVGELVGVEDRFIVRAMRNTININSEKQREKLMVHRRFYTALALHDLVSEVPLNIVASKFNCTRGMLQSLQQSASTYAGMVTSFCRRLGWSSVELLVDQFQDRLHFGTQRELLDLLRLPSLNGPRARAIFNTGVTSLAELAAADVLLIENALHAAIPFLSEKEHDGESTLETERRKRLKGVWVTGRQGLSERDAAELIINEARSVIMKELGVKNVNWEEAQSHTQEGVDESGSSNSVQQASSCDTENIIIGTQMSLQADKDVSRHKDHTVEESGAKKPSDKISRILESLDIKTNQMNQFVDCAPQSTEKCFLSERKFSDCASVEQPNHPSDQHDDTAKVPNDVIVNSRVKGLPNCSDKTSFESSDSEVPKIGIQNGPDDAETELNESSSMIYLDRSESDTNLNSIIAEDLLESNFLEMNIGNTSSNSISFECPNSNVHDQQISESTGNTGSVEKQNGETEIRNQNVSLEMLPDSSSVSNSVIMKLHDSSNTASLVTKRDDASEPCSNTTRVSSRKNSLDIFFDSSSFSNTALAKLSMPVGTSSSVQECENENRLMQRKNSFDSLFMATLSESAFSHQPESDNNCTSSKQVKAVEQTRRTSIDLFSESPDKETNQSTLKSEHLHSKDDKSNATSHIGSTYYTPSSRVLRSRTKNSSSGQKTDVVTSPSLFGDSLVVNSYLCNVLDGQEKEENRLVNGGQSCQRQPLSQVNDKAKTAVKNTHFKTTPSDRANACQYPAGVTPTFCEVLNIYSVNTTVSGSTCKKRRKSIAMTESPDQSGDRDLFGSPVNVTWQVDEVGAKKEVHLKNAGSSHLSLQKRANVSSKGEESNYSCIITDSFLEAAEKEYDRINTLPAKRTLEYDIEDDKENSTDQVHSAQSRKELSGDGKRPRTQQKRRLGTTFRGKSGGSSSQRERKHVKLNNADDNMEACEDNVVSSPETIDALTKVTRPTKQGKNTYRETSKRNSSLKNQGPQTELNKDLLIGPPQTRSALRKRQEQHDQEIAVLSTSSHINADKQKLRTSEERQTSVFHKDWSYCNIIDVCGSSDLFHAFSKAVVSREVFSISLACEQKGDDTQSKICIGTRMIKQSRSHKKISNMNESSPLSYQQSRLVGVALCFEGTDAYYINLQPDEGENAVSLGDRLDLLQNLLVHPGRSCREVRCFDMKEQYKFLYRCTGIAMGGIAGRDPKVADWLLEPGGKEKNLQAMVVKYLESALDLVERAGNVRGGVGSPALDLHQTIPARERCSVEAIISWHLITVQCSALQEAHLFSSFIDVEMPVLLGLARMELNGIGFSSETAETLRENLLKEMSSLEEKAYQLAGRAFSLTSPADTLRVIYQELRLGSGSTRRGVRNTSKEALLKLRSDHPLPDIIIKWRKMNSIATKIVFPLMQPQPCSRMFGRCISHTATGRISMHEPNLQNIPRDFNISTDSHQNFSLRLAFVPLPGNLLVAADYSQLELRLLAHLSGDTSLLSILNSGHDVFRSIAASWNNVKLEEVTDELRQRAKQICYGIIYGMGARALAEQLEVEESEAAAFLEGFRGTYPGVRSFLENTVQQCRQLGFVETLLGRRRYLPSITSSNSNIRAHAERQAVNTTVQGSAADLAKSAMVAVDKELRSAYPTEPVVLQHGEDFMKKSERAPQNGKGTGPHLILHLHDELLYEVSQGEVHRFARILGSAMESAIKLSVKLPVKVRVGESWGTLRELSVD